MATERKICSRCVMDTTDPDILFDEEGVCNHCTRFKRRFQTEVYYDDAGQRKLELLIQKIKQDGKNKEYDCIVGVSGGVDSTFVAYKMKELGLRPLAVHLDNGWDSELAVSNIEKVLDTLDIDLLTYVIDWEEFKDLQLSFLKASVLNVEIPTDHAIMAFQYKVAAEKNIRYIISGRNIATEGSLPKTWNFDTKDLYHLKAVHRRFGSKKLKNYPMLGYRKLAYYTFVKKIRSVPVLNYIPYVKSEAMRILQEDLGWKYYGGKHYESVFTRFYQTYFLPRKYGIDKRTAHLSGLIWSGQMTRDEALEELKKPVCAKELLEEDKEYVIKKFGLTEKQLEEIIALPPRDHEDFPSCQFWLTRLKAPARWAKRKATYNFR